MFFVSTVFIVCSCMCLYAMHTFDVHLIKGNLLTNLYLLTYLLTYSDSLWRVFDLKQTHTHRLLNR